MIDGITGYRAPGHIAEPERIWAVVDANGLVTTVHTRPRAGKARSTATPGGFTPGPPGLVRQ